MAIGTAAAIIGGAALSAGGSILSATSAKKGAKSAANAQAQASAESNALQREIYNRNEATLSPFVSSGVTASNYLNAFLGLPTQSTSSGFNAAGYLAANPDVVAGYNQTADKNRFKTVQDYAQWHYDNYGKGEKRADGGTVTPAVTQDQSSNAFSGYLKNSDYAYQSALGGQQVSGNYSGLGTLQSGAALKALQDRQNNINQGYQTNWLGQLASQQGVGLSAGSALAGVGQGYANSVTANNNNAASAAGNAALVAGNNNAVANSLGTLGGTFLSYGLK